MGRMRCGLVGLFCLLLLAGHTALAQGHVFTLREHRGEGEPSRLYMYNGQALTVGEQADDGLPMLVEAATLSATQRVELDSLAWALWDAELVGSYTNPDITGGHGLTLALADAEGATRQAYISNYKVQALADLVSAINRAVPEAHQSDYALAALPLLPAGQVIVADLEAQYFATEVGRINQGRGNIGPVLAKLRRADRERRGDPDRAREARAILEAVIGWSAVQHEAVHRLRRDDLPSSYALAEEVSGLLGRDALSEPFDAFLDEVRADRSVLRGVQAELALRDAKLLAVSIGLGDDIESVQWDDRARMIARELGDRMDTIGTVYRGTDAADEAGEIIEEWREQVRTIEARQPAWLYTWHIDLIPLGTEQRIRLQTDYRGELITEIDTEIIYDTRKVIMHGTFQNTSSEPHRYTFVVGLSANNEERSPFVSGEVDQLLGFERVQTPLLQPGELHEWTAEVALRNIRHIRRGGLGVVVADRPGPTERSRRLGE